MYSSGRSSMPSPMHATAHAMSNFRSSVQRGVCLGVIAAMLGACAVGPDFVRPAPPEADRYTREPLAASHSRGGWPGAAFHARRRDHGRLVAAFQVGAAGRGGPTGHRQQSDPPGVRGQLAPEPGQPARRLWRVLPANRGGTGRQPTAHRAVAARLADARHDLQSGDR